MAKVSLLDKPWQEISAAATTMPLKQLLVLLREEIAGKARFYVLERLYSGIRKQVYVIDLKLLKKGELPEWIKHL